MSEFSRYPPVLDVPGVADLLGISIEETRRLVREGWIPSTSIDGATLFHRDQVVEWLREQRTTPPDSDPGAATIG